MNRADLPSVFSHSDSGNAAVELLAVALVGGITIITFGSGLFVSQRDSFAAEQVAREAVRLASLSEQNTSNTRALIAITSQELKISEDKISIDYEQHGDILRVKATVNGQSSYAAMRTRE